MVEQTGMMVHVLEVITMLIQEEKVVVKDINIIICLVIQEEET